ncbi:hypothetical protein KY349_01725 [Candidatus Woesearchaeota archaeon]|nr:hypothetical protein [Candidatus Woesearchaeota archaeon]
MNPEEYKRATHYFRNLRETADSSKSNLKNLEDALHRFAYPQSTVSASHAFKALGSALEYIQKYSIRQLQSLSQAGFTIHNSVLEVSRSRDIYSGHYSQLKDHILEGKVTEETRKLLTMRRDELFVFSRTLMAATEILECEQMIPKAKALISVKRRM